MNPTNITNKPIVPILHNSPITTDYKSFETMKDSLIKMMKDIESVGEEEWINLSPEKVWKITYLAQMLSEELGR